MQFLPFDDELPLYRSDPRLLDITKAKHAFRHIRTTATAFAKILTYAPRYEPSIIRTSRTTYAIAGVLNFRNSVQGYGGGISRSMLRPLPCSRSCTCSRLLLRVSLDRA
jgi:hypothetical protein